MSPVNLRLILNIILKGQNQWISAKTLKKLGDLGPLPSQEKINGVSGEVNRVKDWLDRTHGIEINKLKCDEKILEKALRVISHVSVNDRLVRLKPVTESKNIKLPDTVSAGQIIGKNGKRMKKIKNEHPNAHVSFQGNVATITSNSMDDVIEVKNMLKQSILELIQLQEKYEQTQHYRPDFETRIQNEHDDTVFHTNVVNDREKKAQDFEKKAKKKAQEKARKREQKSAQKLQRAIDQYHSRTSEHSPRKQRSYLNNIPNEDNSFS